MIIDHYAPESIFTTYQFFVLILASSVFLVIYYFLLRSLKMRKEVLIHKIDKKISAMSMENIKYEDYVKYWPRLTQESLEQLKTNFLKKVISELSFELVSSSDLSINSDSLKQWKQGSEKIPVHLEKTAQEKWNKFQQKYKEKSGKEYWEKLQEQYFEKHIKEYWREYGKTYLKNFIRMYRVHDLEKIDQDLDLLKFFYSKRIKYRRKMPKIFEISDPVLDDLVRLTLAKMRNDEYH